jgi:hypothetical protein
MTRKFIFHIGPPKTGTSSLQEALFQHRDQLLARGCHYPDFGRHAKMQALPGHHGIPDLLRRKNQLPSEVLKNLQQLPKEQTVIFSSENFAHLDSPQVATLLEALQPGQIEVIYYARRWDQLLPSAWQELVKHGHSTSYLEFLNRQISAPRASKFLNYMIPLDHWSESVGAGNIRIFSYDNILAQGQDIVQHFCREMLDLELAIDTPRQDNPRQTAANTETLRQLNRLYFGPRKPSPQLRMRLEQRRPLLQEQLSQLEEIYRPHMAQAQLGAPMVFATLERQFLKTYGHRVENLGAEGRLFTDNSRKPGAYVRPDYLLETGVCEQLQALLERLDME